MLGATFSKHSHARRFAQQSVTKFELLEERTVLSAMPLAEVSVAHFNHPPKGTDNTVVMSGNTYTFTAADFGFSDPGDVPPDLLQAVRINSLPPRGTLMFAGSGVAAGQFIPASELTGLTYNISGVEDIPYATFSFQLQDDGGSISGGTDLDPSPNSFTFILDTQETNYVQGLYQDVLERTPDLAGLLGWLQYLDAGASRREMANAFWETPEHRGLQVDGYYQRFFGRQADAQGRQTWINQMVSGATEESVMVSLMNTTEYRMLNASDEAFVAAAYNDLFNRAPDANGGQLWINALATGQLSRAEVARRLIDTRERHLLLVDTYYEDFLNRQADSQGLYFWTGQLDDDVLDDQAVAERLLATPEYYGLSH